MSTKEDEADEVCASCGIKGGNDINLKRCNGCKLVRYCSAACQKEHRAQHKRACKRRAAELRVELLFKQPESSHLGDCPIYCLPLPLDLIKSKQHSCCSKIICNGCVYATRLREEQESQKHKCPFCRTLSPDSDEEMDQHRMKRMEANDPVAIYDMGMQRYQEQNYISAFELWGKAAELGHIESHYRLAHLYMDGEGVEKDENKGMHHFEEAAIGGHPTARYYLGRNGGKGGRIDRGIKHLIIAANLGHNQSMESLKELFRTWGLVKKEDLAAALRAHKDAVDATKSPQRDAGDQFFSKCHFQ